MSLMSLLMIKMYTVRTITSFKGLDRLFFVFSLRFFLLLCVYVSDRHVLARMIREIKVSSDWFKSVLIASFESTTTCETL